MNGEKVIQEIKSILKSMEIKPHLRGYRYWITAVSYAIKNPEYKMGKLYEFVAKRHKTTVSKAEKALRYSQELSKSKEVFDVNYKLNNSSFLALFVEELNSMLNT